MAIKNAHLLVSQSLNTKYVLEGVSERPPEGDKSNFTQISIPSVGYICICQNYRNFSRCPQSSKEVLEERQRYGKSKKNHKSPLLPKPRLPEEVPP